MECNPGQGVHGALLHGTDTTKSETTTVGTSCQMLFEEMLISSELVLYILDGRVLDLPHGVDDRGVFHWAFEINLNNNIDLASNSSYIQDS